VLLFISIILFIFITFASGFLLSIFIFKEDINKLKVSEIGFLGFANLTLISFFFHFFTPLNQNVNLIIAGLIIIIFFLNFQKLKQTVFKNYKILFIFLILTFILTIFQKPHEDYGYYHLPYIVNVISDKVIFGLSNLQSQYAWNSSWLNISSLFNFYLIGIYGPILINSVLFFFISIFFYEKFFVNKKKYLHTSDIFILFFGFYFFLKFTRLTEYGFDVAANFFVLLIFYYFCKFFENKKSNLYAKLIFIFSSIAVTIKLTAFISIVVSLIVFFIILKQKNIKDFSLVVLFCFLTVFFWIAQQLAYSGCISPFLKFSCFENLEWYNNNITSVVNQATGAFNKSFSSYSGPLDRNEYVKNFNWIPTWFSRNKIEFAEHILTILSPALLLFILNRNSEEKKNVMKLDFNFRLYNYILIFSAIGFSVWFIKSPVIRFGVTYIYCATIFFIICIYTVFLKKFYFSNKSIKIIFIICLIFSFLKNVKRSVEKYENYSVLPGIIDINYSTYKLNDFNVNYPDEDTDYHQLKYCWSIPYPCHISGIKGKKLDIFKKFGYTFILKK